MMNRIKTVLRGSGEIAGLVCCGLAFALGASMAALGSPANHALGAAPCVWAVPIRSKGNALDAAGTIRAMRANHFDCYVQVISTGPPNSYEDLEQLLPVAQKSGISVWAVLIPPTEGGNSLPYRTNFPAWMKALAKLSLKYHSLRGVNIDDLFIDDNARLFTRDYLCGLYRDKERINPALLFVPTVYDLGPAEADQLAGCVDGVWFWWVNLDKNDGWRSLLEDSRAVVKNRFPVYGGVYAHSTSWHKQGDPEAKIMKGALEIACKYSDGAVIWNLSLKPGSSQDELLRVARSFAPGGAAALAGHCGLGQR
ncbi:MAG: hypothetical protein KGM47_16165 [Acidobacteriota bacterium]|nr:hypothetical protein [Acidobacteriota bacterium]